MAAVVAGCSSPVEVDPPTPNGPQIAGCQALVDDLPDEVDDRDARDTTPDGDLVAAWGDPAIVLRCGVGRPPGLQPTSFCFVINDVGWYGEAAGEPLDGSSRPPGPVVFTTIGRAPYVEVTVPPADEGSPVDPLADVAAAVREHTDLERPCR